MVCLGADAQIFVCVRFWRRSRALLAIGLGLQEDRRSLYEPSTAVTVETDICVYR